MTQIENVIARSIYDYENPERIALSSKYPQLKKPIMFWRQGTRKVQSLLDSHIKYSKKDDFFECIVARHQSALRRSLGDSDARLQEQKIINLKQAILRLNGVTIQPGDIFSLWQIIGRPTYKNGYVDGMLLANGAVVEGIGGGLCQLSNFLYWIFLHAPIETIERHHHSLDVFPDSGRTLPFGGGATIMYNLIDLKIRNTSKYPLQLKIWLTDAHLKGQLVSPHPIPEKFHVFEKNHLFVKRGERYFRYNEIYREAKVDGKIEKTETITTNFAPVLYNVTAEYLRKNNFEVLDFTSAEAEHVETQPVC
ncbi:MAG: VanW family protein [Candidatus Berkelbacteria bacterium]|nr:VanW family protein [Candidatus Berkelbacteria bacterium]